MFIAIICTLFLLCIFLWWYTHRKNKKVSTLPPGPRSLPIIGSLHRLDPREPHISLTNFAQKYGPIYSIKLGSLDAVVISDAKILKKALMKNETLERPPFYILDFLFQGKGLIYSPVHVWKHHRKFISHFLRTVGAAKTSSKKEVLENCIREYTWEFVQHVREQGEFVTLNPSKPIVRFLTSITSNLFLGKSFSRDSKTMESLIHNYNDVTKQTTVGGVLNFLSFLRVLPKYKKTMVAMEESVNKTHQIIAERIAECKAESSITGSPSNLIEAFLSGASKFLPPDLDNEEQLRFLIVDMFGASTETTVNSLLWIVLFLAKYENVQTKVRQELLKVLQGKSPEMSDLVKLAYTQATIAEVARIRTIAFLGLPHQVSDDIELEGFKIPKGTAIMPLLWAIHTNPTIWNNPEEFRPERFLNEDGQFFQPESFLPFQTGKRMCVGDDLAKMITFLFISVVIQNFQIEAPRSSSIDLSPICGLALMPKPQELLFTKL